VTPLPGGDRALFDRLPRLADLVPFVALADGLPTPVEPLADGLWVQRDDRSSSAYGGNKVRKLEFLLPVARRRAGRCSRPGVSAPTTSWPPPSTAAASASGSRRSCSPSP
jgi:hypothetical protein